MKTLATTLLSLALALSASAAQPFSAAQEVDEVRRFEPTSTAPRGEVLEWTARDGRAYQYRLPRAAGTEHRPSLVLLLHGAGADHRWAAANHPIAAGRFRADDVVVAPRGLAVVEEGGFDFARSEDEADQIADLITLFCDRFDVEHVFLYGHGSGGSFCYWFAGERPDFVEGLVAHAAKLPEVRFPALAREHLSVAILHAAKDPVAPVADAESARDAYIERGYAKVRYQVVEDVAAETAHGALPQQTAALIQWLEETSVHDAARELRTARIALTRDEPDFDTAARAVLAARAGLADYKCGDKDQVASLVAVVEGALVATSQAAWTEIEFELIENSGGKVVGTYASCVRWMRNNFELVPSFAAACAPYQAIFARHDETLQRVAAGGDRSSPAQAKALLDALRESWLAKDWNDVYSDAIERCESGWTPLDGFRTRLDALGSTCGVEPMDDLLRTARSALARYAASNPGLLEHS